MRTLTYLLVALASVGALGCVSSDSANSLGGGPGANAGGDFGATQGGVQDMTFARETVAAGRVPPPEAFVVEAMFSEHDLPLEGEPCTTLLCLRAATGLAERIPGEMSAWVQVGMSSTVDPETFERPSLSVIAVVDVSGSMGWDYGNDGTPGALSSALLRDVAERLGEDDRFALVTYGSSARVALQPGSASDQGRIREAIDALSTDGSTNMEAGLRVAYGVARDEIGRADQVRLMLFTDVQPNVGLTEATEFERLASEGASDGLGLTVFAVGLGLNPDVLRGMSQIRNANAFSLTAPEHVGNLMEDSWPWMVSPIAHALSLRATASDGFVVAEGYGFPESTTEEASLSVSSVFLSRRRGALLLRIDPETDASFETLSVEVSLEYETLEGELRTETFLKELSELTDQAPFEQPGVRKTVLLARLVAGMEEAAELYGENRDEAIAVMQRCHSQLETALEDVDDPDLDEELAFSEALLRLMRDGASQESLYGGF